MSEKNNDRLAMIKHLSMLGGDSVNVFESYIPSHYAEVYAMYNILKDSNIDYEDITFLKPKESGKSSFIFVCKFSENKDIEKLLDYIESSDGKIKYMRNHEFKISLVEQLNCTNIKFKQV